MLRTIFTRTLAVNINPAVYPGFYSLTWAQRGIATGASRLNTLRSKATNEEAVKGTEGLHREDSTVIHASVSITPVKGDWVLFHPVYTPEELKSVEVNISSLVNLLR